MLFKIQYENCIKKFSRQNNTELLQYLARAHFKAGQLKECKTMLLKVTIIVKHILFVLFLVVVVLLLQNYDSICCPQTFVLFHNDMT